MSSYPCRQCHVAIPVPDAGEPPHRGLATCTHCVKKDGQKSINKKWFCSNCHTFSKKDKFTRDHEEVVDGSRRCTEGRVANRSVKWTLEETALIRQSASGAGDDPNLPVLLVRLNEKKDPGLAQHSLIQLKRKVETLVCRGELACQGEEAKKFYGEIAERKSQGIKRDRDEDAAPAAAAEPSWTLMETLQQTVNQAVKGQRAFPEAVKGQRAFQRPGPRGDAEAESGDDAARRDDAVARRDAAARQRGAAARRDEPDASAAAAAELTKSQRNAAECIASFGGLSGYLAAASAMPLGMREAAITASAEKRRYRGVRCKKCVYLGYSDADAKQCPAANPGRGFDANLCPRLGQDPPHSYAMPRQAND
mmetsp:Transcript_21267/g.73375  ORF Transcript_21267/g.73375 Transcript_21267/m.73375 type:complete len:365 (+) Transcript_21267:133-1227(+)